MREEIPEEAQEYDAAALEELGDELRTRLTGRASLLAKTSTAQRTLQQ